MQDVCVLREALSRRSLLLLLRYAPRVPRRDILQNEMGVLQQAECVADALLNVIVHAGRFSAPALFCNNHSSKALNFY